MYKKTLQVMRGLQVTPLRIPYAVKQEVCAELERAIEYKPDGRDVCVQMYTERVPLKGIRSKFEVFGLDKKGTRYPVYQSDYFDMPPCFSHPALQKHWYIFKWYPAGVHAGGISKNTALHIEAKDVFTREGYAPPLHEQYYIFVPNVPESERAS
nr:MAG TPA: hypothetical protein [Caudoviricetes sp.]